jgi:hypothetical protein
MVFDRRFGFAFVKFSGRDNLPPVFKTKTRRKDFSFQRINAA